MNFFDLILILIQILCLYYYYFGTSFDKYDKFNHLFTTNNTILIENKDFNIYISCFFRTITLYYLKSFALKDPLFENIVILLCGINPLFFLRIDIIESITLFLILFLIFQNQMINNSKLLLSSLILCFIDSRMVIILPSLLKVWGSGITKTQRLTQPTNRIDSSLINLSFFIILSICSYIIISQKTEFLKLTMTNLKKNILSSNYFEISYSQPIWYLQALSLPEYSLYFTLLLQFHIAISSFVCACYKISHNQKLKVSLIIVI